MDAKRLAEPSRRHLARTEITSKSVISRIPRWRFETQIRACHLVVAFRNSVMGECVMEFHPLSPFRSKRGVVRNDLRDPFSSFRTEMDQLVSQFFGNSETPTAFSDFRPSLDVAETDKEITLKVDLPGIDEKDVELEIEDDILRLRGERIEESQESDDERRYTERRYGRFERSMRLPFEPGDGDVKTDFAKGVLSIRIAKPKDAKPSVKRIPIGRAL